MGFTLGTVEATPVPGIWVRQNTPGSLAAVTTAQPLFTPGTVTLATGVYVLEGLISISLMSATTGNGQFLLKSTGTAVLEDIILSIHGIDGSGSAAAQTGTWALTDTSAANMVSSGTGTSMFAEIAATFDVTTAGTLIPSIALTTAIAATVNLGSYLRFTRLGASNATFEGSWA